MDTFTAAVLFLAGNIVLIYFVSLFCKLMD